MSRISPIIFLSFPLMASLPSLETISSKSAKKTLLTKKDLWNHLPLALIFGNEMRGVGPDILKMCEYSLEIPQDGIKHSLNVATSSGIVIWECYRQNLLRRLSSEL